MGKLIETSTLVHEYDHWAVIIRRKQVTAGSLILASKGEETRFSDLPIMAFSEFALVVRDVERVLQKEIRYSHINYLMLMMRDPGVHFHVFPRYEGTRVIPGTFIERCDTGFPKDPDRMNFNLVEGNTLHGARDYLSHKFKKL